MNIFCLKLLFGLIGIAQLHAFSYYNKRNIDFEVNSETNKYLIIKKITKELQNVNIVLFSHEKSQLAFELSQVGKSRIIIYGTQYKQIILNLYKYEAYILVSNNLFEIQDFFDRIYDSFVCNHAANYAIFTSAPIIEEIFKTALKYRLYNFIIINKYFEIFTYFPYGEYNCGNNTKPIQITSIEDTLYPVKISNNMHGCHIKILAMNALPYVINLNTSNKNIPESAGIEVTIIHTILTKINLTGDYYLHPTDEWGFYTREGKFTQMYKQLYDKKVDFLIGMHRGNETLQKHLEASVFVYDITGAWFVPVAQQIAQWKNVTVIFDPIVWLSIFIVLISNGISWWILGRNREIGASYNELSLCLMGSFYILLQGSFTTPSAWKLRFVVIIWSISCLLIFTAHQCQLTGILTSPLYEHQISNKKELVNSKLGCGLYESMKNFYSDQNNEINRKILKKSVECNITPTCTNRTAFKRDIGVLKNKRQVAYLIPKWYISKSGNPLLYCFKENEFLYLGNMYTYRGFPFMDKINQYIMLLKENGFIDKWEKDLLASKKDDKDPSKLEALSLNHLQAAFYLLTLGLFCATFLFVGEILYSTFNAKEKNGSYKQI